MALLQWEISEGENMKKLTCSTYTAEIYMAGDIAVVKQLLREYCLKGFCVSIEPVHYIYTMGSGATIKAANNLNRNVIGIEMGHCEKKDHKYEGMEWTDVVRDCAK